MNNAKYAADYIRRMTFEEMWRLSLFLSDEAIQLAKDESIDDLAPYYFAHQLLYWANQQDDEE